MRQFLNKFTGVVLALSFFMFSANDTEASKTKNKGDDGGLMKRSEIEAKYVWNLEDLFKTPADWEKEYKALDASKDKFKDFEGKLGQSADMLAKYFEMEKDFSERFERLRVYASLAKDLNQKDNKNQAQYDRIMNLYNQMASNISFVRPELLAIPKAKLKGYLADPKLQAFTHYFDNMLRFKEHTLPKPEEKIMSYAGPVESAFMKTYSLWANADIQFPSVEDENGENVKMSHARYYSAMYSTNREFRERAYQAIYIPFMNNINFLTSNYVGSIQAKIFRAKSRGYENTLEAALDKNNIPVEVYHNLVNTVNENLEPLHRWGKLKKKVLKVEELHPYDTYVTLFPSTEKKYTPEEAMDLCLKALKPLGEDYITKLKFAFDNRWVDFYETDGKRSGAYSTGPVKGAHPYVLMNWGYTLNDVFTLAHEMGHNMHSFYTQKTQNFPYSDYPIFVAEVASITNEVLLLNYLIDHAETKEEKMALIETALNNIKGTFYRQTRFAEFEMVVQSELEKGNAVTPDKLAETFGNMYQKYWGDDMFVDEEERNSWPRIHHFYYDFYVYQYATSLCAAEAIAAKILNEGQPAVDKYLNFLKSGNSKYAIPTLMEAGVDMRTKEPILAVIAKANRLLDELEKLIAEK